MLATFGSVGAMIERPIVENVLVYLPSTSNHLTELSFGKQSTLEKVPFIRVPYDLPFWLNVVDDNG